AAVSLAGDVTAALLRNLSTYLETNAGQHAGLDSCIPVVTQAAHRFAARDYAQAFNLIWNAYRLIATIRAADPSIPPLQAGGEAGSEESQSIHSGKRHGRTSRQYTRRIPPRSPQAGKRTPVHHRAGHHGRHPAD